MSERIGRTLVSKISQSFARIVPSAALSSLGSCLACP